MGHEHSYRYNCPVFCLQGCYKTPYEFADSNLYSFNIFQFQGNVQSSITSTGLIQYGVNIPWVGYSLSALGISIDPRDSFVVNAQNDTFSSSRKVILFPATYNSTWSSAYHSDFSYIFSDSSFNFNHAHGVIRSYITEVDTVKGYGIMRVKNLTGGTSSYFNVLQVQTTVVTIDSFFLNDSLPSLTFMGLLNYLGFTQGQADTTFTQYYYRTGEVTPFAQVSYNNASYSHPVGAATHIQRLVNEGVANVANDNKVSVYPNPVSGGEVYINLPAVSAAWSYELLDINGKVIQAGDLKANNTNAEFTLISSITPGNYYLRLNNNNQQYCVKQVEVIK
jgi:hypothetical protein